MDYKLYSEIKGYLNGISNVLSFLKGSYIYTLDFMEYAGYDDVSKVVDEFINHNLVIRNNITNKELKRSTDWRNDILELVNRWFFNEIAFSETEVGFYENEHGEKTPLNRIIDYNYIADGLIRLISSFIGDDEINVYKLITVPTEQDEFAWEQYVFQMNSCAYVLQFYRQG